MRTILKYFEIFWDEVLYFITDAIVITGMFVLSWGILFIIFVYNKAVSATFTSQMGSQAYRIICRMDLAVVMNF